MQIKLLSFFLISLFITIDLSANNTYKDSRKLKIKSIGYSSDLNLRGMEDVVLNILEKNSDKLFKKFNSYSNRSIKHRILQIEKYEANGENNVLIVAYSSPKKWECHACSTLLSFFIFKVDSKSGLKKLGLKKSYIGVMGSGEWGVAQKIKLIKIGDNKIAITQKTGSVGQGYFEGYFTIAYISKNKYQQIFHELIGYNDDGAKEISEDSWESDITYLNNGLPFFDIQVLSHGLKAGQTFSEKTTYTFDGSKYIITDY